MLVMLKAQMGAKIKCVQRRDLQIQKYSFYSHLVLENSTSLLDRVDCLVVHERQVFL